MGDRPDSLLVDRSTGNRAGELRYHLNRQIPRIGGRVLEDAVCVPEDGAHGRGSNGSAPEEDEVGLPRA